MNHKTFLALFVAFTLPGATRSTFAAAGDPDQVLLDDRAREPGFQKIFNGLDLAGWTGDPRLWSVKEGAITGQTTKDNPAKGNTFLIWTNGEVGDFELRCSFKLTANNEQGFCNSGIQYRSKILDPKNWVVGGYQADMEAGPTYTGILYEERMSRAIMAARGEKVVWDKDCNKQVVGSLGSSDELRKGIKQGDWNDYIVIAQGNHLQHFINGQQMVDVIDDCAAKRAMSGVLALQLHAGQPMTTQFRNLRLKTLAEAAAPSGPELQKLQGTWRATHGEANGSELPVENMTNTVLTIKDQSYSVASNDFNDHGTFKINPSTTPKQMDIHPDNFADDRNLLAIYEVGPDSLKMCYGRGAGERPKSFSTDGGERLLFIEYKRNKE